MLIFCRSSIYSLIFPYKKKTTGWLWILLSMAVLCPFGAPWLHILQGFVGDSRQITESGQGGVAGVNKNVKLPSATDPWEFEKIGGLMWITSWTKELWQAYHGISSIHEVFMHFLDTSTVDRIDGYYSHCICTLSLYLLGIIYKRSSKPRKFLHYSLVM